VAHSNYHVIGITESWCNESISDGELGITFFVPIESLELVVAFYCIYMSPYHQPHCAIP